MRNRSYGVWNLDTCQSRAMENIVTNKCDGIRYEYIGEATTFKESVFIY